MADEQPPSPAESGTEDLQGTLPGARVEAPALRERPEARWSTALLGLAALAVLLTVVGIFGQMKKQPDFLALGLGLVLWGLLDLIAQARGLVVWKGAKAVIGNSVNLIRGLALLGLGVWLALMAMGTLPPTNTAVLTDIGAFFLAGYLGVALGLEIFVKDAKVSGQAFLLAALGLQFVSFLYFSLPFTFGWAVVFAALSFTCAAWAVFDGVLAETPALSRAVLIATLALGAPVVTFTVEQMFFTAEQPLFTPTLLVPRMRQVLGGLGEEASQIVWAPVHTQAGQPGDVRYSDKIAFTDSHGGVPAVGLFVQNEERAAGELTWVKTGSQAQLTAFSQDGRLLAYTDAKTAGVEPHLAVLGPSGNIVSPWPEADAPAAAAKPGETAEEKQARLKKERAPAVLVSSYSVRRPYGSSVAPGPEHGQVWRDLGRQLYFASPSAAKKAGSTVYQADLTGQSFKRVRSNRSMPAVSPDGSALLTVGFEAKRHYLEMADGFNGERHPRLFQALREKHYFPAWNANQTRVIFLKDGRLHTMKSNGVDQHLFEPEKLDSRLWFSAKKDPFTLEWKETGEHWKVYRSDPKGAHEKLIYDVVAKSITAPSWSADGQRVAFAVNGAKESYILTLGSDGSWVRRFFITSDPLRELRWSPDGLRLAWLVDRGQDTQEAWTATVAGLDPVRVYESHGRLGALSWSPVGKHLAMEEVSDWRFLWIRVVKPDLHNVIVVDLAENKARVMTRYGLMARQPAFSPQGVAIAYFTDFKPWAPAFIRERRSALVISQLY